MSLFPGEGPLMPCSLISVFNGANALFWLKKTKGKEIHIFEHLLCAKHRLGHSLRIASFNPWSTVFDETTWMAVKCGVQVKFLSISSHSVPASIQTDVLWCFSSLHFTYNVFYLFFLNWRFVAALHQASLSASLFLQHLLTFCLGVTFW